MPMQIPMTTTTVVNCPPPRMGAVRAGPTDTASLGGALPAVPSVRGPVALRVAYPVAGAAVNVRDSSFLFGSTGTGAARLTINGTPVRVWPNGAWLAWVALPQDSVMRFHLEAVTDRDTATLVHELHRGCQSSATRPAAAPQGKIWWPAHEDLPLSVYAPAGASVRLHAADGVTVPFIATTQWGATTTSPPLIRYEAVIRGQPIGRDPGPVLARDPGPPDTSGRADSTGSRADPYLEVIQRDDTLRAAWPLQVALLDTTPIVVAFDDDTARRGDTDRITVGRATPGGTYHWFFPTGVTATVTGRINEQLRVRLAAGTEAWVATAEALVVRSRRAAPAIAGSITTRRSPDGATVRIPLTYFAPFHVVEQERSLVVRIYNAVGDIDWIRYAANDSLVRGVTWEQRAGPEVTVTIELAGPVWGYRMHHGDGGLVLEIRRPPAIDRDEPLRQRRIVIDPGHPPGGASGPTGLREAEANLAVAQRLRRRFEAAGATVLMTRTTDSVVDLWPRVQFAERSQADLLISIHNNALPDGVNPFTDNGTTVFYNHPRSAPLARMIQQALVRRLGIRDLGIGRGDLALVRSTWMPSVLTEGLFLMVPEQEAALRSAEGQERYAQGVFEGVRRYLQAWER